MSTLVVSAIENASGETPFQLTNTTPQATTSGTAFDFTSIPTWVNRVTVHWDGVSLDSTDLLFLQVGTLSGGISGTYYGNSSTGTTTGTNSLTGWYMTVSGAAAYFHSGITTLERDGTDTNLWVMSSVLGAGSDSTTVSLAAGNVTLASDLDRVRVTRTGSGNFDAGQVSITYE